MAQPGGTVLIGGASGLIGSRLVAQLRGTGQRVRVLVRRPATGAEEIEWSPAQGMLPTAAFDGVDRVVVLSGAGIAAHRWSPAYRRTLLESRTSTVGLLASRMAELGVAARLITASAVGFYGDRGEQQLTERDGAGVGFLAELCQRWEQAAAPATAAGIPVAHARTGIVLTRDGGAIARLLPLVRLGLAGPLGSGRQWWPWITLEDQVRALVHLTTSDLTGPVNLTAPQPERNAALIRTIARAFHRPAVIPVPRFALRLAIGGFGAELTASQRVLPAALLADNFEFHTTDAAEAARRLAA